MTPVRVLIIAFLVTLLALTVVGAFGEHRQADYETIVRWAGCKATLVTDDTQSVLDSHYSYSPAIGALSIGTREYPGLSQELAEMVLFHEIGHCLQHQAGLLDGGLPVIVTELDADRWAADLACGLGRDGKGLLHDIFVWAYVTFGYEGDWMHGTLNQRIAQGSNAPMCKLIPIQAPVVAR